MAEQDDSEKTEQPTQKKLDDALKKGDVAKSQEMTSFAILLMAGLIILAVGPQITALLAVPLAGLLRHAHHLSVDGPGLLRLSIDLAVPVAIAIGLPILALALAAIGGNMIQHRMVFSAEQMKPKMNKISPIAGFKRLFGPDALMLFVKGLIKIVAVSAALAYVLWPERQLLDGLISTDVGALLGVFRDLMLKVMIAVLVVMAIMAAVDMLWQRHRWVKRQMMSLRELREEFKQTEGNPEIKAKVKAIRRERARKRMMAEVPKAAVVITNPTHFAVALAYDSSMAAPVCVAKGVDALALKIREVATGAGVPIVENPPLARTLHAAIDLEDEVPPEHYKAVAEVIGYVMSLKNRTAWRADAGRAAATR